MIKEKFENGYYFRIEGFNYYGSPTFKYNPSGSGYISRQSRYSLPDENEGIVNNIHELNIIEINNDGFKGFTYILDTKVEVSYKFDQLIEYIEPVK